MVEFNREIIKEDKKSNHWKFFFGLLFVLIIVLFLVLIKLYKDNITNVEESYILGVQNGTVRGYTLGKSECVVCPQCICESPNQTVLNLAKEQTKTSNIILFNGSHIVSLPLNSLCEQLKKNV